MSHKHVVIGGGFSGLRIARLLANREDIEVTVVNPQYNFEYHGSLYRSANGFSPLETIIPYREIFRDSNVKYVQDFMTDIVPAEKRLKMLSGVELKYDSATLALGYEPEYFGIPGMREFSKTLYSMPDALELRKTLKLVAENSFHKSTPARIIVVGGGPTGIEVAASVPHFFELITGDRRLEVILVEAQKRILSGFSEEFSNMVMESLENKVEIRCNQRVIRATKESLHISESDTLKFDVLIWTAGSSANSYFRQRPDLFDIDVKGRVIVDEHLKTRHDSLYGSGDSASIEYSGTAHAAIEMGEYIANDVISNLQNKKHAKYEPTKPNYAVPVGHNSAVASDGDLLHSQESGWDIRRRLDLEVLLLIAPDEVARQHWAMGENIATVVSGH